MVRDEWMLSAGEMQRATAIDPIVSCMCEGRGTRTPFRHRGIDHRTRVGEVLHMDTYYVDVQRCRWTQSNTLCIGDEKTRIVISLR